ncbi:hypothetical protein BaRGS_00037701, partial [Batillaria attramentaria]
RRQITKNNLEANYTMSDFGTGIIAGVIISNLVYMAVILVITLVKIVKSDDNGVRLLSPPRPLETTQTQSTSPESNTLDTTTDDTQTCDQDLADSEDATMTTDSAENPYEHLTPPEERIDTREYQCLQLQVVVHQATNHDTTTTDVEQMTENHYEILGMNQIPSESTSLGINPNSVTESVKTLRLQTTESPASLYTECADGKTVRGISHGSGNFSGIVLGISIVIEAETLRWPNRNYQIHINSTFLAYAGVIHTSTPRPHLHTSTALTRTTQHTSPHASLHPGDQKTEPSTGAQQGNDDNLQTAVVIGIASTVLVVVVVAAVVIIVIVIKRRQNHNNPSKQTGRWPLSAYTFGGLLVVWRGGGELHGDISNASLYKILFAAARSSDTYDYENPYAHLTPPEERNDNREYQLLQLQVVTNQGTMTQQTMSSGSEHGRRYHYENWK